MMMILIFQLLHGGAQLRNDSPWPNELALSLARRRFAPERSLTARWPKMQSAARDHRWTPAATKVAPR
jgi:hypothetical protein